VPGSHYDGAWTWTTTDNAAVVGTGVQDPAHNFAFEVHQYLDADGSCTHPGVVSAEIGVERLTAITQWAEATGHRLFLGEVGVATDQTSLTALDRMLSYMHQHADVWQGVTYWAGGPWWGDYMFSIEPQNGIDKPQMAILMARGDTAAVSIPENTSAVTTVTATHPDAGQTLSYSISGGADAAKFIIGPSTGALSFVTAPNFELPTDVGGDNVYDVIVQVSDGHGGLDTQAIAVTVCDVVESAPTVAASDQAATRGQVINASSLFSASDADGDNLLYSFYDNTLDPASGHFTVNGMVQAAGTTFAVTAAQLAQTTFTAGTATSDDLFVNVWDGSAFSGPKEFHVNVPANQAPTVTAPDFSASKGQLIAASSLFSANDADGDSLLYFFYDNSAAATSGHFTVNGVVQAANTTFAASAAQLGSLTFTAGTASSDNLLVNAWDGSLYSGPKEFHVNIPANRAPTVTASDISTPRGDILTASQLFSANDAERQPAVLLLRQQRGPDEWALHGQRRGAGGRHDLRGVGGTAGVANLHGGDSELRRSVRERLGWQPFQRAERGPRRRSSEPRSDGDGVRHLDPAGRYPQRVVAVLGERRRRRPPAVLLLRRQRGPSERPLHGRRRGAGGGQHFRCVGGPAGADHLHGGDIEL
jgi:hypothetical protein